MEKRDNRWWLCIVSPCVGVLLLASLAYGEAVDGFVTAIDSPAAFDAGTMHVVLDAATRCEIQPTYPLVVLTTSGQPQPHAVAPQSRLFFSPVLKLFSPRLKSTPAPCEALHLAIGSSVHLEGNIQSGASSFRVTQLVLYVIPDHPEHHGVALIEEPVDLRQSASGQPIRLWLDGYPMTVTSATTLTALPTDATLFLVYGYKADMLYDEGLHVASQGLTNGTAVSANALQTNTWVDYKAVESADGSVKANQLRLWHSACPAKLD